MPTIYKWHWLIPLNSTVSTRPNSLMPDHGAKNHHPSCIEAVITEMFHLAAIRLLYLTVFHHPFSTWFKGYEVIHKWKYYNQNIISLFHPQQTVKPAYNGGLQKTISSWLLLHWLFILFHTWGLTYLSRIIAKLYSRWIMQFLPSCLHATF